MQRVVNYLVNKILAKNYKNIPGLGFALLYIRKICNLNSFVLPYKYLTYCK